MKSFHRASPPISKDDSDDRPLAMYLTKNRYHQNRPLIEQVNNAWLDEKKSSIKSRYLLDDGDDDDFPDEIVHCCDLDSEDSLVGAASVLIKTRRFRRTMMYIIAALLGIYCVYRWFLKPDWDREHMFMEGFNNPIGTFGMQEAHKFKRITQIQELPAEYLPGGEYDPEGKRRLIFVGDIHGCRKGLQALMDKVNFNKDLDHLVCTGDVVSKGPDSLGVVDTLISLNASSVRGNHEDKVIIVGDHTSETAHLDEKTRKHRAANLRAEDLAPYFHPYQLKWLRSLPLILHVPAIIPPSIQAPEDVESQIEDPEFLAESRKKNKKHKGKKARKHVPNIHSDIHVVHGGLVPGIPLTRQDPYAVMNMRSMSPSSHVPSRERDRGVPWERIWGWYNYRLARRQRTKDFSWFAEDYESASSSEDQEGEEGEASSATEGWRGYVGRLLGRTGAVRTLRNQKPAVVVYGHDSPRGLNLHRWSKGLDSGCVHGRQLTAMVVNAWGQAHLVQTKCKDHM